MAKSNKESKQNNIKQLNNVISTDTSLSNQPEGTYRFGLNIVTESKDGDLGFSTNEKGNSICVGIPEKYVIVGNIPLLNNESILFLASETEPSIIGKQTKDCKFEVLVKSSCLSFKTTKHIKAKWRLLNGCDIVIYFVDGNNTDKSLNLNNLGFYTNNISGSTDKYPVQFANDNDEWNCSLMKLESDYLYPCITLDKVNANGGNLKLGMYQFAINYSDGNQTLTNYPYITDNIPITSFFKNIANSDDYISVEGGDPTLDGATNNSINIVINNLDTTYPFFNLIVVETISGATTPYIIEQLPTSVNPINYTYRGTTDNSIPIDISDLIINKVSYKSSESIEIADNRLFRTNLKDKNIRWGAFQMAANNIQSTYFTKSNLWSKEFAKYQGAKNPNTYFDNKSYMRDEVYALGIVWVFKDGTESPVFHIPGRMKDTFSNGTPMTYTLDPNPNHTRYTDLSSGGWDSSTNLDAHDTVALTAASERWQVYNTAIRTNVPTDTSVLYNGANDENNLDAQDYTKGELAYFESDLSYPNDTCENGLRIYPEGNIRFHKTPDTTLEPCFVRNYETDFGGYYNYFTLQLGLKFSNIQPPTQYANDIQGYFIVRSQRTESNKTVLDKGILMHNVKYHYDFNDEGGTITPIKTNNPSGVINNTVAPLLDPYAFHTQTCLANRHWWSANKVEASSGDNLYNIAITNPTDTFKKFGTRGGKVMPRNFSDNDSGKLSADQYYDLHNLSFHSPKIKFDINRLNGNLLKVENKYDGDYSGKRSLRADGGGNKRMSHYLVDYNVLRPSKGYKTNYLIDQQFYVDPHTNVVNNGISFVNKEQQETYVIQTNDNNPVPYFDPSNEVTIENAEEGDAIENSILTETSTALYASIKKENPSIYGQVTNISYIKASKCMVNYSPSLTTTKVFGGDCFITRFGFEKSFVTYQLDDTNDETLWKQMIYYFVESEINTELRHEFRDSAITDIDNYNPCTTYYPKESFDDFLIEKPFRKYLAINYDDASGNEFGTIISKYNDNSYCKNYYAYNQDYSRENIIKSYFPLQTAYNFCSNCDNEYPHRIIFSQQGFQEQSTDFYRNFLANSYDDIEGNQGVITDIWKYNNMLYIHTEQGLIQKQIQVQQLETTSGEAINLGKSDVLSAPPNEVRNNPLGYAGNQHKQALAVTEVGAFFPDAQAGKVFLVGSDIIEISENRNRNWFEENLPIKFLEQFYNLTQRDYPFQGTSSNLSVGLQSTYDTRHKRFILTKRDFMLLQTEILHYSEELDFDLVEGTIEGEFVFVANSQDYDNGFYIRNGNVYDPDGTDAFSYFDYIDITDSDYFENLSWTISYDTLLGGWKSFHSYLPNYIYNTQSKFFSFKENNLNIWEHNIGEFQTFYGIKYPFIIETIFPMDQITTNVSSSIDYLSNISEYNSVLKEWKEVNFDTFNKAIFYTSNQSTGLLNLIIKNNADPFASILNTPNSILVNKKEKTWSLNNFRNNVINENEPLFSKSWNDIKTNYFIDKVSNQSIIDYNKSLFTKDKLRDKFIAARFIYDNPNNRKLIYKFISTKNKISYR